MINYTKNKEKFWRYERKVTVNRFFESNIHLDIQLHPAMFREVYHPRTVNNIYFDTIKRSSLRGNVEGELDRRKFRIRWYGDQISTIKTGVLELKIKHGFLGRKEKFNLRPFQFSDYEDATSLFSHISESNVPDRVLIEMSNYKPVLMNSYHRRYFLSGDGQFRLTLDTNLKFCLVTGTVNDFVWQNPVDNELILELKYTSHDEKDDEAREILSKFRHRVKKSSKFVKALSQLEYRSDY